MTPEASFYMFNMRTLIEANDSTKVLLNAMYIHVHWTGIEVSEISA
jgi:hypothetical protein